MANRRVSMKGKGAALFYGDEAPAAEAIADVPEQVEAASAPTLPVTAALPSPLTVRTDERTNGRTPERTIIRHSFDIRRDQLQALAEIQAQVFASTGRKPKMGELAQEALDLYIADDRERKSRRMNE